MLTRTRAGCWWPASRSPSPRPSCGCCLPGLLTGAGCCRKTQILTQVWGYDGYDPNLVEAHVSALRRKLEAHGPRLVHTVRGVGYRVAVGP